MKISQIWDALSIPSNTPKDAAKAGFLEWVIGLPDGSDAQLEARQALRRLQAYTARTDASKLFLDYLHDATKPSLKPCRRGGAQGQATGAPLKQSPTNTEAPGQLRPQWASLLWFTNILG